MNLALTSMRQWATHGLAALGVLAAVSTGSAHAGNVGISVGIHVPGAPVYRRCHRRPPPRVHYYHPVPPPVAYYPPPAAIGYWGPPPHHHKKAYKQYRKEYKRYHKHHYRDYDDD